MTEPPLSFMDYVQAPVNRGRMDQPDRTGCASQGSGGAAVMIYLRVKGEVVTEATFESHGCGYTIASGSLLTELVVGKTLAECRTLRELAIEQVFGLFPPHKRHCPALAVAALHEALE